MLVQNQFGAVLSQGSVSYVTAGSATDPPSVRIGLSLDGLQLRRMHETLVLLPLISVLQQPPATWGHRLALRISAAIRSISADRE